MIPPNPIPDSRSSPSLAQGGANPAARFLGSFFAIIVLFYGVSLSPWMDAHALYPVMEASARGASALLNLCGVNTTVNGVVVRGGNYAIAVRRGCDPLEPIVLFGAGVVAFPARWHRKFAGWIIGGAILFGLNLVRLATLYVLGARHSPWLENVHLDWWPAMYLLFALALWALWLRWTQFLPPASASGRPEAV